MTEEKIGKIRKRNTSLHYSQHFNDRHGSKLQHLAGKTSEQKSSRCIAEVVMVSGTRAGRRLEQRSWDRVLEMGQVEFAHTAAGSR